MNTKLLLSSSALVMGAAGLIGTFLPHDLLRWAKFSALGALPVIVQLTAALLLGFAIVNWMARGSLLGGIYNRPLVIGNLTHFTIGALALSKHFAAGDRSVVTAAGTVVYVLFAIAFATTLFRSPVQPRRDETAGSA